MSAVDVLAVAAASGLAAGNLANVVFTVPAAAPMMRKISSVSVVRQGGRDLLVWRWIPSGSTPWGTTDCGFAGNAIDDDGFIAALAACRGDA